jgi:hypothetical protein
VSTTKPSPDYLPQGTTTSFKTGPRAVLIPEGEKKNEVKKETEKRRHPR